MYKFVRLPPYSLDELRPSVTVPLIGMDLLFSDTSEIDLVALVTPEQEKGLTDLLGKSCVTEVSVTELYTDPFYYYTLLENVGGDANYDEQVAIVTNLIDASRGISVGGIADMSATDYNYLPLFIELVLGKRIDATNGYSPDRLDMRQHKRRFERIYEKSYQ